LSQIIDPSGKRIATVPMMEDAILEGTLHRRTDQTIYVRVGWLFPWLITAVALLWVGFLFVRSRRDQARL
jgi:apolipoprotein N-acyltransferase